APVFMAIIKTFGDLGVKLFFVISGFVISLSLSPADREPPTWLAFMKKRVWRLQPTYAANLLIISVGFILIKHRAIADVLQHGAAQLIYVHERVFGSGDINFVGWSLEVEVQFYLTAPLLLNLARDKRVGAGVLATIYLA